MDGRRTGFQPDAVAPALLHDLRLLQLQLPDGGHHDAVAGGFHLFQRTAHLFVLPFGMGQFQNAGHQARFVADLQPGLFAEHLIEDLRLQLHNHPHTALCQIHAAYGGALHGIAVQQRPICAGRDVLHAGDVLCQLHRSGVHLCLQPVAVLQPVDPPGQGQIQLPHREFVQHLPQNIPQRGGVQIHATHR